MTVQEDWDELWDWYELDRDDLDPYLVEKMDKIKVAGDENAKDAKKWERIQDSPLLAHDDPEYIIGNAEFQDKLLQECRKRVVYLDTLTDGDAKLLGQKLLEIQELNSKYKKVQAGAVNWGKFVKFYEQARAEKGYEGWANEDQASELAYEIISNCIKELDKLEAMQSELRFFESLEVNLEEFKAKDIVKRFRKVLGDPKDNRDYEAMYKLLINSMQLASENGDDRTYAILEANENAQKLKTIQDYLKTWCDDCLKPKTVCVSCTWNTLRKLSGLPDVREVFG